MRVFVLGGTGSIGSAVVQVLQERGHKVLALGRSSEACQLLREAGAIPIDGNMRDPMKWVDIVDNVDGVIQAAAVWGNEMGDVDCRAVEVLLEAMRHRDSAKSFVYTGGCWLYGETGDVVATEKTPLNPIASFAWAIPAMQMILSASHVRGMVIHPAMVYERNGGVFRHFFEDAKQLGYIRVIGGEHVRWPLVHRMDLAGLYVLMIEKGKQGDVYNAAAIEGVSVGAIVRTIANRLGIKTKPIVCDVERAMSSLGNWAEGYALDQQMSGRKAMAELGWYPEHTDVIADIA
jgi:nucleoside-diphosphate-sugar epimerase